MKRFTAITLVIVILISSITLTSCDASNVVVGIFRELIGALVHKHTPGVMPAIESTCSEHGFTEGSYCVTCGETLVPQKETPLKPHTQVIVPAVESTCVNNGKSEGIYCLICSKIIIEPKTSPLAAHSYSDDNDESCNVCGYLRDVKCAHSNLENLPEKESSCTETGLTAGVKCKDCDEIILAQESTPFKEHVKSDWIIDKNATETEEGLKHIDCLVCKQTIIQKIITENVVYTLTTKSDTIPNSDPERKYDVVIEYRNRTSESIEIRIRWTTTILTSTGWYINSDHLTLGVGAIKSEEYLIIPRDTWPEYSNAPRSKSGITGWFTIPLNTIDSTTIDLDIYYCQKNEHGSDMTKLYGWSGVKAVWTLDIPAVN